MEIDKKEILRYLGYKKTQNAEEAILSLIDSCIEELKNTVSMKSIYSIFDLNIKGYSIQIGDTFFIQSKNLSKNLQDCEKIILFAATLGPQPDLLMKRYTFIDMTRVAVLQAAAAAMIEEYCDECQRKIEQEQKKKKLYLRPRFSPGYGDFDIKYQQQMISILDCPRKIGLTLTDSFILAPSKSVTAVIGLSQKKKDCHMKGCEVCNQLDCAFRRE